MASKITDTMQTAASLGAILLAIYAIKKAGDFENTISQFISDTVDSVKKTLTGGNAPTAENVSKLIDKTKTTTASSGYIYQPSFTDASGNTVNLPFSESWLPDYVATSNPKQEQLAKDIQSSGLQENALTGAWQPPSTSDALKTLGL